VNIDWGGPWWIGVIVLAIASVFWARRYESRKLGRQLLDESRRLEMTLTIGQSPFSGPAMEIALFQKGWNRTFPYYFSKTASSGAVVLGEYSYVFGFHPQKTFTQTFAAFYRPRLPVFTLAPATILDRIGMALGLEVIDIPFEAELKKRYMLRGKEPAHVQGVLKPSLVGRLNAKGANWSIESSGNWLVVYEWDKTTSRGSLNQFLADASEIAKLFT
jgi:hypothetical protein